MTWDDWFKRRMRTFFGPWDVEIEEMMKEMERMFQENMKNFEGNFPKELVREYKTPDGKVRKEWGPFVYGYSVTIGPDGKPMIREFGNMKPSITREGKIALKEGREPMVDIITSDEEIRVVAEIPGVSKEEIQIKATENMVTIQTTDPARKYHKEVDLPDAVDPGNAKSTYKNGILEITLKRKGKKDSGIQIKIE
jgi:HSP20 family protein